MLTAPFTQTCPFIPHTTHCTLSTSHFPRVCSSCSCSSALISTVPPLSSMTHHPSSALFSSQVTSITAHTGSHTRAHLVSLVAVCCRDSSLSWSDCSGRMFFSSSSLLDGRLLSLMARESFLKTFMASVPSVMAQETKWVLCVSASC